MADVYEDLDKIVDLANRVSRHLDDAIADAASDVYCDRDHCDDYSCNCRYGDDHAVEDVKAIVGDYLRKIRMGYTLDVTLRDVLEEMERSIQW